MVLIAENVIQYSFCDISSFKMDFNIKIFLSCSVSNVDVRKFDTARILHKILGTLKCDFVPLE